MGVFVQVSRIRRICRHPPSLSFGEAKKDCNAMNEFQKEIKEFCEEREWGQFFDPKDLLLGIVEEVGEVRNVVKWLKTREEGNKALHDNKAEVQDAVGDILWFLSLLANAADVDMDEAIKWTIEDNRKRFPVDKVKGKHTNTKAGGHDGKYRK